jgi:hypothetical protein
VRVKWACDGVLTMVAEVEAAVNPDALFADSLVVLRRDWPFSRPGDPFSMGRSHACWRYRGREKC